MRHIALDSNGYTGFKKGHPEIIQLIQHADILSFSTIVLGELLAGFANGTRQAKNKQELDEFLGSPRVKIYPIDATTTIYYAQLYKTLKKKGHPIPTNDMWIAASALQHGCALLTFDKHFDAIDGLLICRSLIDI